MGKQSASIHSLHNPWRGPRVHAESLGASCFGLGHCRLCKQCGPRSGALGLDFPVWLAKDIRSASTSAGTLRCAAGLAGSTNNPEWPVQPNIPSRTRRESHNTSSKKMRPDDAKTGLDHPRSGQTSSLEQAMRPALSALLHRLQPLAEEAPKPPPPC